MGGRGGGIQSYEVIECCEAFVCRHVHDYVLYKIISVPINLIISGTMAALLQEIVAIYPAVNPSTLTVSIVGGCGI